MTSEGAQADGDVDGLVGAAADCDEVKTTVTP